jgi:hypothetical protein
MRVRYKNVIMIMIDDSYDAALMTDIRDKCRLLKAGAIVITLAQQLESEYCQLLYTYSHQMTWGVCKVHVQTRYGKPKQLKADAEWKSNMYTIHDPLVCLCVCLNH